MRMSKGFSLIELIIAVFMIGIIVAMSTGFVYFLLVQYPGSLQQANKANQSYSSVMNDMLLIEYSCKIKLTQNGLTLYYWDIPEQKLYTRTINFSERSGIGYMIDESTKTVTIMVDNSVFRAHSLITPVPFVRSIQVTGTTANIKLAYPANINNMVITPSTPIVCTSTVNMEDIQLCAQISVATSTTPYSISNIQDMNGNVYNYTITTTNTPDALTNIPNVPAFIKDVTP